MVLKIPPPPPIANQDPTLNRWLLEVTAILNNQGNIDQTSVAGLPAIATQTDTNTTGIGSLNTQVAALNTQVTAINASIVTINAQLATLSGQITTLQGRVTALEANGVPLKGAGVPAAGLGKVGDWYANIGGGVGQRIYVKTAVGVWTPFPF